MLGIALALRKPKPFGLSHGKSELLIQMFMTEVRIYKFVHT